MLGIQPKHTAGQQAPQTVYNLEVQGQHVFRVTSNGLLVHNSCLDEIAKLADGFGSFRAFKRAHGSAGKGNAWHHIVEQTPNASKFTAQALHNPANIIKLPHGKGTIHAKISGYYSSKPSWTGGLTVRQWISQKSFAEQFEFGIKTIKQFGGTKYLPNHLQ